MLLTIRKSGYPIHTEFSVRFNIFSRKLHCLFSNVNSQFASTNSSFINGKTTSTTKNQYLEKFTRSSPSLLVSSIALVKALFSKRLISNRESIWQVSTTSNNFSWLLMVRATIYSTAVEMFTRYETCKSLWQHLCIGNNPDTS